MNFFSASTEKTVRPIVIIRSSAREKREMTFDMAEVVWQYESWSAIHDQTPGFDRGHDFYDNDSHFAPLQYLHGYLRPDVTEIAV